MVRQTRALPPSEQDLQLQWRQAAVELGLSAQQVRIVLRVMRGLADKQIALELSLSKDTVRTYLNRIFRRLGVSSRVGLVLAIVSAARPACPRARCPYKR